MSTYEAETALSYRTRAEQLRAIAASDTLEQTRRVLLKVAVEYEEMAVTMDALARRSRSQADAVAVR